jgi:hypothetical protein
MTNYRDSNSSPAATGPRTPDSPIPAISNNPSRSYSRNSEPSTGSRTDRNSAYSAGRTSQSHSREELLNQTIGIFLRQQKVSFLLVIGSQAPNPTRPNFLVAIMGHVPQSTSLFLLFRCALQSLSKKETYILSYIIHHCLL